MYGVNAISPFLAYFHYFEKGQQAAARASVYPHY
jgi:hypothetical protein